MSNSGLFYLDSAGHSAKGMWFDMLKGNANQTQCAYLLGGEVSMWQDRYVGSCLFPNDQARGPPPSVHARAHPVLSLFASEVSVSVSCVCVCACCGWSVPLRMRTSANPPRTAYGLVPLSPPGPSGEH